MPMDLDLRDHVAQAIERGAIAHARALRTAQTPEKQAGTDLFIAEIQRGDLRTHSYAEADEVLAELRRRGVPIDGDALPSCSRSDPIGRDFFITSEQRDAGEAGFDLMALSNAVQVWSAMQGPAVSVAQAARAFNCEPAIIADAVRLHYWMFLETPSGHMIDGFSESTGRHDQPAAIDDYTTAMIAHEGE